MICFVSSALLRPQPALLLLLVGTAEGCDLLILKTKDCEQARSCKCVQQPKQKGPPQPDVVAAQG
ncbi:hypothetical protein AQS70_01800 [Pseudomonas endophytica]|uniref:Uncharacterized protein n=1 Tax=Pseudomonas endophytica TaxID=1563157 RepID=A0A0N8VSJ6_9PSED|nr:hypothetical protein AQS70_01800 [Pseudomonas endophytica]